MYITLAKLAERPGALELAQVASTAHQDEVPAELMDLSLRGGDRSAFAPSLIVQADEALARIVEAVEKADGTIDGFLRRRGYPLPLIPVPPIVAEWSRAIARYYLHKDNISDERTNPIARDYRDAMKLLQMVAEGKFSLGIDDPLASDVQRDVRSFGAERQFTADTLRDYE